MRTTAQHSEKVPANHGKLGFALVVTVLLMVLLAVLAVGLLSLSAVTQRANSNQDIVIARANAHLALDLAIAQLQKTTGPDQRITANADIFSEPGSNGTIVNQPYWTGVWKTTLTENGAEYPLVGKNSDDDQGPYAHASIYSDLRNGLPDWRESQRLEWLVSGGQLFDPITATLNEINPGTGDGNAVALLDQGTLSPQDNLSQQELQRMRVLAPVIEITSETRPGAYAWWVSDNSQKASLAQRSLRQGRELTQASQDVNPSLLGENFQDFFQSQTPPGGDADKLISRNTLGLTDLTATDLGSNYHAISLESYGLFTDTLRGGLRKDLTPALFSPANQPGTSVTYPALYSDWPQNVGFFSSDPITPSIRHAVAGPHYDSLVSWGSLRTLASSGSSVEAQTQVQGNDPNSIRLRAGGPSGIPGDPIFQPAGWVHLATDGYGFSWQHWGKSAPKLHPIVTDAKCHFAFDYHEPTKHLRINFHPRVCLWNPYNIPISTDELIVGISAHSMLSGYQYNFNASNGPAVANDPKYAGTPVAGWQGSGFLLVLPTPSVAALTFVLEPVTLQPGECLVFFPQTQGGATPVISDGTASASRYDITSVGSNRLSPRPDSPSDFFYFPVESTLISLNSGNIDLSEPQFADFVEDVMDTGGVTNYGCISGYSPYQGPYFVKAANRNLVGLSLEQVLRDQSMPSLFYFNDSSSGGTSSYGEWYHALFGATSSAPNDAFGGIYSNDSFADTGAPRQHVAGYKLSWLNEVGTETHFPPLKTQDVNHAIYHQAPIANWNIRANYASRSPAAPVSAHPAWGGWMGWTSGAWARQLAPHPPNSGLDNPVFGSSGFTKSPLGEASEFSGAQRVVLFDVPDPEFGALSVGALRHAQVSPFSWSPSYVVGSSLIDQHTPPQFSANPDWNADFDQNLYQTRWRWLCGGHAGGHAVWGPPAWAWFICNGPLQTGPNAPTDVSIAQQSVNASELGDEIYAYDIAYEVNHNLWDQFFFSSLPLSANGSNWDPTITGNSALPNDRYALNHEIKDDLQTVLERIQSGNGTNSGHGNMFWLSSYLLKNKSAFNVNSTSVDAWTIFLSGLRGKDIQSERGTTVSAGSDKHLFSRMINPSDDGSATGSGALANNADAWQQTRALSDEQIQDLATAIVEEVRLRGPFISVSDFVNRRLSPVRSNLSKFGTIDSAIQTAGLNVGFADPGSDGQLGSGSGGNYVTSTVHATGGGPISNKDGWDENLASQPLSKAFGATGYLTQGDILQPLAPAITARGDHFTIRAYGDSRDANGAVLATAILEATVVRTPEFIEYRAATENGNSSTGNRAIDPVSIENPKDGSIEDGLLTPLNKRFGRAYKIISVRWLNKDEI